MKGFGGLKKTEREIKQRKTVREMEGAGEGEYGKSKK